MTTYCAPCLADLALVREATTAVGGTASCTAHAVLLSYPTDDPQRRRSRLAQLRDTAQDKLQSVGPEERLRLEVLVEEYSLASVMESLVPRRRPEGQRHDGRPGEAPLSRSARKRRGRDRDRPAGGPGGAVADGGAEKAGADALEQVGAPSGEPPSSSGEAAPVGGPTVAAPEGAAPGAPAEATGGIAEAPSPEAAQPAAPAPPADSAPAEAAGGLASEPSPAPAPSPGEPTGTVTPGPVSPTQPPEGGSA